MGIVSHSLADDDDDLITVSHKTPGNALKLPVKTSTDERPSSTPQHPPISIFKPEPKTLISGYLRRLIALPAIPYEICAVCDVYYAQDYKLLVLNSDVPSGQKLEIKTIDDHCFQEIVLGHDTHIIGAKPILKLSSMRNLKLEWNSRIEMAAADLTRNGTIVLSVAGDISVGKNAKISSGVNGNIYIRCKNLILRTGAVISTSTLTTTTRKIASFRKAASAGKNKQFGNIYLLIEQSLIMDSSTDILSGSVNIDCGQIKVGPCCNIKALRKNLQIRTRNGIACDTDLKQVLSSPKGDLNIWHHNESTDTKSIHETIKQNLSHKLTMFEGGSDEEEFECVICWNHAPNIMIKPCNHCTFCEQCMKELSPVECPICRETISHTQKF